MIHVSGLYKAFKHTVAVQDLSFDIPAGQIVGYLGPNGAGKSTTIKVLSGLLAPDRGEVRVGGLIPWKQRRQHVARLGAVFGQRSTLWWDLPVRASLELLHHIYRVPKPRFEQNLRELGELLELSPFLDTPVRQLSLGQRMRADLAAALLHDPTLLFLDEPTVGLDTLAKENIRHFIQHINRERGVTVLLTTHDLGDVARLAQRVMVIDAGCLVYDGDLDTLHRRYGQQRQLLVDFSEPPARPQVPGLTLLYQEGQRYCYGFTGSAAQPIAQLSTLAPIHDLTVQEPDLEDTIRRIYQGSAKP